MKKKRDICQLTGKEYDIKDLVSGDSIRQSVLSLIKKDFPDFKEDGYISQEKLNFYRQKHLKELLSQELGELNELEKEVFDTLKDRELLSKNVEEEALEKFTLGERLADRVARFGGSWVFIISFFSFIVLWMTVNIFLLVSKPFDPYPFILLNLVLSCLAAIQAPIIMMSQNRQEAKDRLRSEHDYQVNLKSELEIRQLHEKIDHLINKQMIRLMDSQEIQAEYLQDILNILEHKNKK